MDEELWVADVLYQAGFARSNKVILEDITFSQVHRSVVVAKESQRQPFSKVTTLRLKRCQVELGGGSALETIVRGLFPNVHTLNGSGCASLVNGHSLVTELASVNLPGLKYLYLGDLSLTSHEVGLLGRSRLISQLESLSLAGNELDEESLRLVVEAIVGSKLERIDLGNTGITSNSVGHVCRILELSNLVSLSVVKNDLRDVGFAMLARTLTGRLEGSRLSNLTSLCLNSIGITESSAPLLVDILESYPQLETLSIAGNALKNSVIQELDKHQAFHHGLKELFLQSTQLSGDGLMLLMSNHHHWFPRLVTLDLSKCSEITLRGLHEALLARMQFRMPLTDIRLFGVPAMGSLNGPAVKREVRRRQRWLIVLVACSRAAIKLPRELMRLISEASEWSEGLTRW